MTHAAVNAAHYVMYAIWRKMMSKKYYHISYISPHKGILISWKKNTEIFWLDLKITKRKHRFYWSERPITR